MELQQYLAVALRRWPIVLLCLVVTTTLSAVFVLRQEPTYQAQGTFVIRPRTVDSSQGLRAMDTLVRGVEINSTYATIARSDRIRERAEARLDEGTSTSGIKVSGEVVTGTNILEIVVSGPDPQAVHNVATAVGAETVAYVAELQDVYELAPLDAAEVPSRPVEPNVPLRVMMGGAFGLVLGVLLGLLAEVLLRSLSAARSPARWRATRPDRPQRPLHERDGEHPLRLERPERRRSQFVAPAIDVDDPQLPGAFNLQLIGALRASRPFSVAVLRAAPAEAGMLHGPLHGAMEHLEALVQELMPALRADDVPAYLGDGTFALMLPDTGVEEAEDLLRAWKAGVVVAAARHGGIGSRPRVSTRVLRYGGADQGEGGVSTIAHLEIG